jgi:YHS domain-containing protein
MSSRSLKPIVAIVAVVVLFVGPSMLLAKDAVLKAQTKCPVMGKEMKTSKFVDHEEHRYFFCCNSCMSKFKKAPAKYVKRMEDAGIAAAKTPSEGEKKESEPKREGS